MRTYFDSSALVAVYVNELHSDRARQELQAHPQVPWTPLHDLEVKTALRLLFGRGNIDATEMQGFLGHIDEDLQAGRYERPAVEMEAIFNRAEALSYKYAAGTLARTLDILHVAALIESGCTSLVSADSRQIALAEAESVRTIDIRVGSARAG